MYVFYLSPGLNVAMLSRLDMAAMRFAWVSITPLGLPVDPEVYMMMATSSGVGGEASPASD